MFKTERERVGVRGRESVRVDCDVLQLIDYVTATVPDTSLETFKPMKCPYLHQGPDLISIF